ncbi:hypothetical protein [Pseudogracilibacillus auburnensis]|uniref:hypothetical protein n=1 Tax=Pseudogracilibacillus auburnensis TaxID=1494959 RepID=UPI001A96E089|nr:hypothetical protein [Pseudogracilibacillus auburnensis]MBO1002335.1 hypothetical protein [Pseudogracilibacillus auburnensis]
MDIVLSAKNGTLTFSYKGEMYPIHFIRENEFYAFIDDVTEPVEILVDENGIAKALSIFHRIVPKKSL